MSLNTEPSQPEERAAHDLPPKSYAEAAEEALEQSHANHTDGTSERVADKIKDIKTNGRISIPADSDQQQFEGAGLDTSPKSPTRTHRRKVSLKSNGSIGRKHGEHIRNDAPEIQGDGNNNANVNGNGNGNGHALTTVNKPSSKPANRPANAKPLARRDSTLQAGRRAGAGWSQSKCVYPPNK
jgi:2-acylglycerol O-acyltransferase 2